MRDKTTPRPIQVLADDAPFMQVPRFFTAELMGSHSHVEKNGKKVKQSERIPASFWKFLFFLWGWIMNGNPERAAALSMRQFPVRPDAAVRWAAAIAVSGVFDVEMGKYTSKHDQPTQYQYRVGATKEEWLIFIRTLDLTLARINDGKRAGDAFEKQLAKGNVNSFKVWLALDIDKERLKAGFPPANENFIAMAANRKVVDQLGRPVVVPDEKGGDGVLVTTYAPVAQKPAIEGHSRTCDCADCINERVLQADMRGPGPFEPETEREPF